MGRGVVERLGEQLGGDADPLRSPPPPVQGQEQERQQERQRAGQHVSAASFDVVSTPRRAAVCVGLWG